MIDSIIYGDCLNVMPTLSTGSVNLVVTDPPYLARYVSRDGRTIHGDDNDAWLKPSFAELFRVLRADSYCVSFYGWPHADRFMAAFRAAGFRIAGHLVFPKPYCSNSVHVGYAHECAYLLSKGNPRPQNLLPDVLSWHYTGNKLHPTQKPLCALRPLVEAFSVPGDLVLDPFAGSGSTLVAARQLARRFIGIEYDAGYHAKAVERLRQLVATHAPPSL
jgi:site-specific DNA-methyltransferase (adenine-specific)